MTTDLEQKAREILLGVWHLPHTHEPSKRDIAAVLAGMRWAAEECARIALYEAPMFEPAPEGYTLVESMAYRIDREIRSRFLGARQEYEPDPTGEYHLRIKQPEGATRQGVTTPDEAEGRSPLVPPLGDRPAGRVAPPASSSERCTLTEEGFHQDLAHYSARKESERAALVERAQETLTAKLVEPRDTCPIRWTEVDLSYEGWRRAIEAMADFALAETAELRKEWKACIEVVEQERDAARVEVGRLKAQLRAANGIARVCDDSQRAASAESEQRRERIVVLLSELSEVKDTCARQIRVVDAARFLVKLYDARWTDGPKPSVSHLRDQTTGDGWGDLLCALAALDPQPAPSARDDALERLRTQRGDSKSDPVRLVESALRAARESKEKAT